MTHPLLKPLVDLTVDETIPPPALFLHPSTLHGQAHVGRVMVHATVLANRLGLSHRRTSLWAAVYLHDIARLHDGICHIHGERAVQRYPKLPEVQALFARAGITSGEMQEVETAVTHHCRPNELERNHPHYALTALLKDADGLDRVRLGDLDPRYLRHPESPGYVPFAQELFTHTAHLQEGPDLYAQIRDQANRILKASAD